MFESTNPTIFALSSGRPPVAIAVIRISGPRAAVALKTLGVKIPEPRKAGLARIRDPRTQEIIDEALVLWFPAPHSETGEDVAELQAHGGRAVIAAILDALARVEGLRMAEPGEFTRRGFENGKLDLTAVEGLADLVSAETEGQRRQAFRQMKGLLGNRVEAWREKLIQALALVEARIDFSDEADVPGDLVSPSLAIARELRAEIAEALADGHRGERLREGLVVAIAGPPNAGKSTLLNRIARREAAIVSPYAGTTRDVIEVHLDLGGLPVTLLDTAGIRETSDPIEMEGVRRARERAAGADLVLWVVEAGAETADGAMADRAAGSGRARGHSSRSPGNLLLGATLGERDLKTGNPSSPPVWVVRNKIDLLDQSISRSEHTLQTNASLTNKVNKVLICSNESIFRTNRELTAMVTNHFTSNGESPAASNETVFSLSAVSGEGFEALLDQLERYSKSVLAGGEQSLITRARHRSALEQTLAALDRALAGDVAGHEDLLAEELRTAASALGRLIGRVDVEDILDVIFHDFCIGK